MILDARERGVPFAWIGMDCFYGEQPWLRSKIDDSGLTFIADVPCDTQVWLNLPKTEIPEKKGTRGRNPTIEKLAQGEPEPVKVQKLIDYQVRGWTAWHHHMVMTLLAMLFIMELQIEFGKKAPMTSVQDVKGILEVIMPRKEVTYDSNKP